MAVYALDEQTPDISDTAWIADSGSVIGHVILGENSSVWFGAVVRGDNEPIKIGVGSNIQDGAVCHSDPGSPLTIGDGVTVGHLAMLHGCTIGDGSLVGIGATVLNKAVIGKNCIVGAHALVTEGKSFPDNSLIVGSPAKAIRTLDDRAVAMLKLNADVYVKNAERFGRGLKRID